MLQARTYARGRCSRASSELPVNRLLPSPDSDGGFFRQTMELSEEETSGETSGPLKPCLLRRNRSREHHGAAASSLEELKSKALDILAIDKSLEPITLVLAEDGTIVEDEDYFLCLPDNTKFVALACNETWKYNNTDGGTAWLTQESFEGKDETDSSEGCRWKNLARQLKGDLSSIILLAEEDLQVLIDVPCSDLAQELSQSPSRTQDLQNTLQQVLDHREEARQSRQLLQLYLQALEKEGGILSKQAESEAAVDEGMDEVDSSGYVTLSSHVLMVLKEKSCPELSLSSQDLELVTKEHPEALARALTWDLEKTEAVQRACQQQLTLRLQQVQSLNALHSISARKSSLTEEPVSLKRSK
ncbi:DNA fragmentation factor subunit alpha [Trichosurus vulpecula]|uniref:DNA fragmentation factor subunit alpha n=1 Tax=Trichosurus vulpecula TaxID=9337 RepID=UPI00186AF5CE|nr:DNA fragmentation factor subunit alpha [Trichosurus vulpecula]